MDMKSQGKNKMADMPIKSLLLNMGVPDSNADSGTECRNRCRHQFGDAKNLGRGNREQANRTAGNAIFVTLCYFVLIFLFGLTASKAFIRSQTSDTVIAEMGTTYSDICRFFYHYLLFSLSLI